MKAINAKTHEVQAILQGRRTQMRRIVKIQHLLQCNSRHYDGIAPQHMMDKCYSEVGMSGLLQLCPYGQPGDILYVRETWTWAEDTSYDEHVSNGGWKYKADHHDGDDKWKPSTQMPKEAARIFLKVKSVRAERLQDISKEDAIAEGIEPVETPVNQTDGWKDYQGRYSDYRSPVNSFRSLWLSVYGSESWNANPWVWVIEFEQVEKPTKKETN